jgi:hypothetical protein
MTPPRHPNPLLKLIAELDDQGSWGLQSCAHWLNWR